MRYGELLLLIKRTVLVYLLIFVHTSTGPGCNRPYKACRTVIFSLFLAECALRRARDVALRDPAPLGTAVAAVTGRNAGFTARLSPGHPSTSRTPRGIDCGVISADSTTAKQWQWLNPACLSCQVERTSGVFLYLSLFFFTFSAFRFVSSRLLSVRFVWFNSFLLTRPEPLLPPSKMLHQKKPAALQISTCSSLYHITCPPEQLHVNFVSLLRFHVPRTSHFCLFLETQRKLLVSQRAICRATRWQGNSGELGVWIPRSRFSVMICVLVVTFF